MFTGIVTDVGHVIEARQKGDLRLAIRTATDLSTVDLGASIACSGVCLTVVDKGDDWFAVDCSAETISRTAAGLWTKGAAINIERALRLGDELGGHLVTGHVDTIASVASVDQVGDSLAVTLEVSADFAAMLAAKGSVTLDGVSLTVNSVEDRPDSTRFAINLIPHTAQRTTLGGIAVGRRLNVEFDLFARYVQRMMDVRAHWRRVE